MKKNLKSVFIDEPEIARLMEQRELFDLFKRLIDRPVVDLAREMAAADLKGEKGDKGDKGEPGYTPVKGQDYFTVDEINKIISFVLGKATPKKGEDYFTPVEIRNFLQSITPKKGIDYKDGENGAPGVDGRIISPDEIAKKLNTLEGEIDPKVIKGLPTLDSFVKEIKKKKLLQKSDIAGMRLDDQRWHGGGATFVAGTNVVFTQNANGTITISAQGGSAGATITSESLAGVQSGDNVTLTFSGLSHTATSIVQISRNGKIMTAGSTNVDGYVLNGLISATVYSADAGDTFIVMYGY